MSILLTVFLVIAAGYWLWRLLQKKEEHNGEEDIAI